MTPSIQIIEMLNELRDGELDRINLHRIDAHSHRRERPGVRHGLARALVGLGVRLDRRAIDRLRTTRQAANAGCIERAPGACADATLHW